VRIVGAVLNAIWLYVGSKIFISPNFIAGVKL